MVGRYSRGALVACGVIAQVVAGGTMGGCNPLGAAPTPPDDTGDSDTTPEESDTPEPVDTYDESAPQAVVRVAAGTFAQGATVGDLGATANEQGRQVTLSQDFEIATTEVTQGQFRLRMGYDPSYWGGCDACPVERVTWHEAAAYANAVSAEDGLPACYTCEVPDGAEPTEIRCALIDNPYLCEGWRLPTEAEWEMAARAGGAHDGDLPGGGELTDASLLYRCDVDSPLSDGGRVGDEAWYCFNSDATPGRTVRPVGTRSANAIGLYDMAGNVWELVNDGWSETYPGDETNPVGPLGPEHRVVRGGGWNSEPWMVRVSMRTTFFPINRSDNTGFRLARTAP